MRYLIRFSYDGSNFYGYQKQPNKRTVQGELENVLSRISKEKISISASGRTDSFVHAINQYAHFDMNLDIPTDSLKKAINSLITGDIYVKEVKKVDSNFHARFSIIKKEYVYKINLGEYNPFDRNYIYQYNNPLDIQKMRFALNYFKGIHNFKSFVKTTDEITDFVREIYDINITVDNDILCINFVGNGFLRYMVRNMVGTIISVGEGKTDVLEIPKIFEYEDRRKAKKTAPACGLYLKNVYYE